MEPWRALIPVQPRSIAWRIVADDNACTFSQRPHRGNRSRIASSVAGWNEDTIASCGAGPRDASRTSAVGAPWSVALSSTSRNASGRLSSIAARTSDSDGTPNSARASASRESTASGHALHARQRQVVEEHGNAVARHPDVELEPITRRQIECQLQGSDRVLGRVPPVAAMRESERRHRRDRGHPIVSRASSPK